MQKESVEKEKKELDRKISDLKDYLETIEDKNQHSLVKLQLSSMTTYSTVLGLRLKTWEE